MRAIKVTRFRPRRVSSKQKSLSSRLLGNARSPEGESIEDIIDLGTPFTYMVPDIFTQPPLVRDGLETHTSAEQDHTVDACLPFLKGEVEFFMYNEHGVPRLDRDKHVSFLHQNLQSLPSAFLAADASRPWFLYWTLSALTMLGEDISLYRQVLKETVSAMQNDTGGFGGGGGQRSHLAPTYAVVLALALVGGKDTYEVVDRKAMWKWLNSLKQPDGGFQVCLGGEEDIRGVYCAAVVITLLRLPLDLTPESPAWKNDKSDLFTGVADYVSQCQTFEGGISGQPNGEAHGAYAFCALGCLSLLGQPHRVIPKYMNLPRLISWLAYRQYAPEGGFSGRTNKLVDGCYSHWVGGCFPMVEACLYSCDQAEYSLPPAPEPLFCREGLIRYILCCCQDQAKRGGLRDKPGKYPDAYHSCYVLSGLSSAQHQWEFESLEDESIAIPATPEWLVLPYLDQAPIYEQQDRVHPIHPVFAIPYQNQKAIHDYYGTKAGF